MVAVREPKPFLETPTAVPQIVIQAAAPAESNHDYDALFQSALSAQKAGDFRKAVAPYTQAIDLNPNIADAYINRGAVREYLGELDPALQDYDAALAIEPRSEAYNNRGNVYSRKGDNRRAIQDYSKALELDARIVSAYLYRGHAFRSLALYDSALRDYSEALKLDPENADAHAFTGVIYSLRGEYNNAVERFGRALRLAPDDAYIPVSRILVNRGGSYHAKGDDDSAVRDFEKVLELDPRNSYAHFGMGCVSVGRGEFDRALREFDTALRLNPEFLDALRARGSMYLKNGDLNRAIQDFDKVLTLDQRNMAAYNDRGVAYQRKGDTSRAVKDFHRSLSIRPNREAFVNRGLALLRLSQWDKARSDLLSARNMGKDLVLAFRTEYADAAAFEKAHGVKLPQDIADMVSVEEPPQPGLTAESMREMFERIWQSVPPDAWDNMPTDGARNYKHYLYGHPKEED